jgi:hypothetical protein
MGEDDERWQRTTAYSGAFENDFKHVSAPTDVDELRGLLAAWAEGFAAACRAAPGHELDPARGGDLTVGARGIGIDEATAFKRTFDARLVQVDGDGRFVLPTAGECSSNLHLVGRSGDHVALHTEYLIHIGAFGELVLDWGWDPSSLAFEKGEFDILGLDQGRVVLALEAKAREFGPDSLTSLRGSFSRLIDDATAEVPLNHRRKWDELCRLTRGGPVTVCLVSEGARWMWVAEPGGPSAVLRPSYRPIRPGPL